MQSTLRELEENACCPHCGHNVYLNFILKRSRRCPNCQSAYRLEMDLQYVVATAACVIIAVVMLLSLTSGVVKVIAAGTVVGNREQECVRGAIQVLTFIFRDGRIHTVGDGTSRDSNGGLGYLADPWGKPCIRGTYINNGSEYLTSRATAAFLEGLAGAYGNAQVRRSTDANGWRDTYISGNTYQYAASQGIGSTAAEIAAYVRERAMDAFDVVYVPQAHKVQIILEQQVDIDYDTQARKVSYLRHSANGARHDD